MKFRRAVQRYGHTVEPVTPYQKAAQVWDERIGSARVQARNWRLMAFGGLALSTGLSGGLLWQSMHSRVVPYVVSVDRLGDAKAVAPADNDYRPTDPQIAGVLARFITCVRSVSLDPVLMRANWLSAFDFTTARGARFLSAYARGADPFGEVGTRTVSIEVTSVVRASDRSFQVKWAETQYDRGNLAGTSHWTAILAVVMRPPASADTLRRNPLGLYVDGIDWAREVEPSPEGSVADVPPPQAQQPQHQAQADNVPLGSPLDPATPAGRPSPSNRERISQ
jgi:type IV secretory pathway TrbF-like protein